MSSPTADRPTRRPAASRRTDQGTRSPGAQLRFVRSAADVDAYAEEMAELLKSRIRRAVPAQGGAIALPSPEDLVQREVATGAGIDDPHAEALTDSALVDTVGPSWSTKKLRAELGGISPQAVHQRVARGTLWALPTSDGAAAFPTFQFVRRNGRLETKRGLQVMFKILRGEDPWAVAVLMQTPAPELEGASPVEWERSGGSIDALEHLAHDVVHGWNRP